MSDVDCVFRDLYEGQQPWTIEEFEAGYVARFQEEPESVAATAGWRAGWADAERELAFVAQANAPDRAVGAPVRLYGSGRMARKCGLPFDPNASEEWKRDWIRADLALAGAA